MIINLIKSKKQTTIVCIIMNAISRECNAFQIINGLTCHSVGTPSLVRQLISHMGLSISERGIYRMIKSLSRFYEEALKALGELNMFQLAYDNFDVKFSAPEPTTENQGQLWHASSATLIPLFGVNQHDLKISQYL